MTHRKPPYQAAWLSALSFVGAACALSLASATVMAAPAPAHASAAATAKAAQAAAPRLVVFIAIDGLPMRQVENNREYFGADGFNRFLKDGTVYRDAHQEHGHTVTCAGHAAMLTGAYPQVTGIIANEWKNGVTGEEQYCADDPAHTYIGNATRKLAGTSPRRLHAETVKAFASPEVRERMAAIGLDVLTSTPQEFAAQIRSEIPRWKKVIVDAKVKVD